MAKSSESRDLLFASQGFLRAAVVAKLFDVQVSTVTRWQHITSEKTSGCHWFKWEDILNDRKLEANMRKLPADPKQALSFYKTLK